MVQLVVLTIDTLNGSDLELPLGGHHLGVGTRDVDTSVCCIESVKSQFCNWN